MTGARVSVLLAALGLVLSSCGFTGLNNTPLPFTEGSGEGSYTVVVEMENAVNLVPNSEVKVGDVTVGSVRKIEFADWHAKLVVGLNRDVRLPHNAVARIGQKSLLGAEYLELSAPGTGAQGTLADGDVIPLSRTGRYPETEEVLGAASLVLNGGGLQHIRGITTELNKALGGRESDVRALITNLRSFVSALNRQRGSLVRILHGMDRLGATLAKQRRTVATALDTIPGGLRVLNQERRALLDTLDSLSDFATAADPVLNGGRDKLVANLKNLRPVLREIADAGKHLPGSFGDITFPFPQEAILKAFKGDYINFFATIDLTLPTLDRNYLAGTPLEGMLIGLVGGVPEGPGTQKSDPLRAPLDPPRRPKAPAPKPPPIPDVEQLPLPIPSLGSTRDSSSIDIGGLLTPGGGS